jgi:hypothetical protein
MKLANDERRRYDNPPPPRNSHRTRKPLITSPSPSDHQSSYSSTSSFPASYTASGTTSTNHSGRMNAAHTLPEGTSVLAPSPSLTKTFSDTRLFPSVLASYISSSHAWCGFFYTAMSALLYSRGLAGSWTRRRGSTLRLWSALSFLSSSAARWKSPSSIFTLPLSLWRSLWRSFLSSCLRPSSPFRSLSASTPMLEAHRCVRLYTMLPKILLLWMTFKIGSLGFDIMPGITRQNLLGDYLCILDVYRLLSGLWVFTIHSAHRWAFFFHIFSSGQYCRICGCKQRWTESERRTRKGLKFRYLYIGAFIIKRA